METIVIILLILAFALAFGIGANDETMAPIVSARTLTIKQTIIIGGVLSFLGCIFLSETVGKTIGKSLLGSSVEYNSYMMIAIIVSTVFWLIVASRTGAPISTTHSVVGSIMGLSFVIAIADNINWFDTLYWPKLVDVFVGWVISPVLGFIGAVFFQYLVSETLKKRIKGLNQLEKVEKSFVLFLLGSLCWTQFSRGGNDAANAIGVFYGLIEANNANPGTGIEASSIPILLTITGLMMMFGLIIVGKNVIENVGGNLVEMRPSGAFAVSLSTTIVIFLATNLGLPVSGTHILIFAIIGAGWVKGESPDKKSLKKMIASWFLTLPIAAILCAIIYAMFLPLV